VFRATLARHTMGPARTPCSLGPLPLRLGIEVEVEKGKGTMSRTNCVAGSRQETSQKASSSAGFPEISFACCVVDSHEGASALRRSRCRAFSRRITPEYPSLSPLAPRCPPLPASGMIRFRKRETERDFGVKAREKCLSTRLIRPSRLRKENCVSNARSPRGRRSVKSRYRNT